MYFFGKFSQLNWRQREKPDSSVIISSAVEDASMFERPVAVAAASEEETKSGKPPLTMPTSSFSSARHGFAIAFENVSLEQRVSLFRVSRSLLQKVSGYLLPGTVTLVMSTNPLCSRKLLEVLVGVEKGASGSVMANALPVLSTAFRKRVALITSTDICSLDATVRSNLLFSVSMRLNTQEKEHIVREVAEAVHLQHFLDLKTGMLNSLQLYQLAVGMELVQRPMLLALDSPTSDFPTVESYGFASFLCDLAGGTGRVVVVSAKELSQPLYEVTDNFLLLGSQGQLLYSGPKQGMEDFFREQPCVQEAGSESLGELLAILEQNGGSKLLASAFACSKMQRRILQQVEDHRKNVASNSFNSVPHNVAPSPNYYWKFFLLTAYVCRRSMIGHGEFVIAWAILFFLLILMASLIAGSLSDQNAMQNKRGVVFFLLSCSMQVNIVLIDAEVREFFSGVHLRNNHYFDTLQYFTATLIRLILPRAVFAIIGAGCTLFLFSSSLALVLTMGLVSLTHASLTLLLVYWHPVEHHLWLIHNVYYGYCIIFSGFLICLPTVPSFFSALSLLRYGYGGVLTSELRHNPYSCDGNASYCYTGDHYLEMEGFTNDSLSRSSLLLFLITVVVLVFVGISMKFARVFLGS